MKTAKQIAIMILMTLAVPFVVFAAQQVPVPLAPTLNYSLVSTSTGLYVSKQNNTANSLAQLDANGNWIGELIFKLGTQSSLSSVVLDQGQPAYATDTSRVYIGDGSTAGGYPISPFWFNNATTTTAYYDGMVGIGSTSPQSTLSVQGVNGLSVGNTTAPDVLSVIGGNGSVQMYGVNAGAGANIYMQTGSGGSGSSALPTGAAGGSFTVKLGKGGTGGPDGFAGGSFNLTAGTSSYNIDGGGFNLIAGDGGGISISRVGLGGSFNFIGGMGGEGGNPTPKSGAGGAFTVTGGTGGFSFGSGTPGDGGPINLTGGTGGTLGLGNANGGNVILNGGVHTGTGTDGNIILGNLNGNVGIGTSTPNAKLNIYGTGTVANFGNDTTGAIQIGDGTISKTAGSGWVWGSGLVPDGDNSRYLGTTGVRWGNIQVGNAANSQIGRVTFATDGSVGIGSSSPSIALSVVSGGSGKPYAYFSGDNGCVTFAAATNPAYYSAFCNYYSAVEPFAYWRGPSKLFGENRLRTNEGDTAAYTYLGGYYGGSLSSSFTSTAPTTNYAALFWNQKQNTYLGTTTPYNDNSARLTIWGNADARDLLHVSKSDGTSLFDIENNGNVGIGTTTPQSALTVVGQVGVNGGSSANAPSAFSVLGGIGGISGAGTAGTGGGVSLTTGPGQAAGSGNGGGGGPLNLTAGSGGAGHSGVSGGAGGTVTITAGDAGVPSGGTGNNGGNVVIDGGALSGSALNGNVLLSSNRGNVGVGTTTPGTALVVGSGDIFVGTSTGNISGIILQASDASCHRITVTNLNVISAATVTCP